MAEWLRTSSTVSLTHFFLIQKANDTNFVEDQGAGDQYKLKAIWELPIPNILTIVA